MDKRVFVSGLIGKPYVLGAEGPQAYDCYGLARHVLRELYGVNLPANRDAPVNKREWRRIMVPMDGAVVLMGAGPIQRHVGVCLGHSVLHAMEGCGVVYDDFLSLQYRGFAALRAYLPA